MAIHFAHVSQLTQKHSNLNGSQTQKNVTAVPPNSMRNHRPGTTNVLVHYLCFLLTSLSEFKIPYLRNGTGLVKLWHTPGQDSTTSAFLMVEPSSATEFIYVQCIRPRKTQILHAALKETLLKARDVPHD